MTEPTSDPHDPLSALVDGEMASADATLDDREAAARYGEITALLRATEPSASDATRARHIGAALAAFDEATPGETARDGALTAGVPTGDVVALRRSRSRALLPLAAAAAIALVVGIFVASRQGGEAVSSADKSAATADRGAASTPSSLTDAGTGTGTSAGAALDEPGSRSSAADAAEAAPSPYLGAFTDDQALRLAALGATAPFAPSAVAGAPLTTAPPAPAAAPGSTTKAYGDVPPAPPAPTSTVVAGPTTARCTVDVSSSQSVLRRYAATLRGSAVDVVVVRDANGTEFAGVVVPPDCTLRRL